MISICVKLTANIIGKHKTLIEDTYNTKVFSIKWHTDKRKKLESEDASWLVFSDDNYIYKSYVRYDNVSNTTLDRQRQFFQYHKSNLIEDYKKFPPYGLIIKQRKVPGVSLSQVEAIDFHPSLLTDWFINEIIHIHEVGVRLSKKNGYFKVPHKTPLVRNGYIFIFGDMSAGNIMYDEKSKELNFVDFEPLGWVPTEMAFCMIDAYLILALERTRVKGRAMDRLYLHRVEEQFNKRTKSAKIF